jgi:integrase
MRKVKKLPKPKEIEVSSRNKELSYEEFARYREGIMNESPMHRTMMELMVFTGIRRGEVAPLEWSDFDFDNGVMYITKNEQYTQERGWYITTPKSGKARMIPLSSYIVDVMKEWQRTQALNNLLKKGITENKYCFEGIDEGCINPRTISNYCLAFGKKYGIEHFHPHRLRHTFASYYETNQSGDMVSLQEILGHADISTTMRYVHTNLEAKRKAMDNYGNVMAPVKDVLYAKTKG